MNARDVPDDATAGLVEAAEANAGSLSAFVVDRFTEVGQLQDCVASYRPPPDSGITSDDAIAAVQELREARALALGANRGCEELPCVRGQT